MKKRMFLLELVLAGCSPAIFAQSKPEAPETASIVVKVANLLDVRKGRYLENVAIWIEGERIKEVGPVSDVQPHAPRNVKVIDFGCAILLPGLIGCHTHIMARVPDGPDGCMMNLATKSEAFRALEGAYDARITLPAGYTPIRDLESEGSGYSDCNE